jgi:hypothetical protein
VINERSACKHFTRSRGHVITEPKATPGAESRAQIAHIGAHPGGAVRRQSLAPNGGYARGCHGLPVTQRHAVNRRNPRAGLQTGPV